MTRSTPRRLVVAAGVPAVIAAGLAIATPADAAPADYQGSSFALKAEVGLLGTSVINEILPEVVTFPSGGDATLVELPAELSEIATLEVLHSASAVKQKVLASNARTAKLSVLNGVVTASVLNADCTAENLTLAGDSQVTELAVAGTKIPIDPGPNFEVEIPTALSPMISGGIYIDEQEKLSTGALQIRALHVRLVIDPLGVEKALGAVVESVRKVAEQLEAAVEQATGQTIEALAATQREARAATAPALSQSTPADRGPQGATVDPEQGTRHSGVRSARHEEARAAVEQKAAHDGLVGERDAQASAAETRAAQAQAQADAAADEAARAVGTQPANTQEKVKKSDRAAVPSQSVPVESEPERARQEAGAPVQTGRLDAQAEAARARALAAQDEADVAAAEARTARAAADEARAASSRPAEAAAPSTTATTASTGAKADRAALPVAGRAVPVAPAAAAPAVTSAEPGLGALGVDVIVSQVTCKGREIVQVRAKPPVKPPVKAPDRPPAVDEVLPVTGGNGNSTFGVGAAGLGLLVVGSGAVFAVRRRAHRGI